MTGAFEILNRAVVGMFGANVRYQPAVADAFDVNAIIDRTTDEQRNVEGLYARLFVNLDDFTVPPAAGDEVCIDEVAYLVFQVQTDPVRGAYLAIREK